MEQRERHHVRLVLLEHTPQWEHGLVTHVGRDRIAPLRDHHRIAIVQQEHIHPIMERHHVLLVQRGLQMQAVRVRVLYVPRLLNRQQLVPIRIV